MTVLEQLEKDANRFIKVELTRLGKEVKFINDIDTTIDSMVGSVIEFMMTSLEPAITQNTNLPEDNATMSSLVSNAVYKALDNVLITGISDMVNRRPGDLFAEITGLTDIANLIGSISNRTSQKLQSNLGDIGRGAFNYAEDISEELSSSVDRIYSRIFNLVGLSIAQEPSMIGTFATNSMETLIFDGNTTNSVFERFNELAQIISDDCSAIDSSYYAVDHFQQARDAKDYLALADSKLVNVRSNLIHSGAFDAYRYGLAQGEVQLAADALTESGNPANRIQEILGAIDSLDILLVDIEDQYSVINTRIESSKDYMSQFEDSFNCSGCLIGIMTNIQAEVRSVMNSIEAAIARGQISVINEYERKWWMQLLALIEKMNIVPSSVPDYFAADPDGYIFDYNTNVGVPMQAITLSDIDLLKSQLSQLKYWVNKKLNADIPVTQIVNLASQMISDNLSRISGIASAISIAGAFFVPKETKAMQIAEMLSEVGMDRAGDLFERGEWPEFYVLEPQTSTYLGQLERSVNNVLTDTTGAINTTVNSIASLNEVLLFVRNAKRSRDVLAATFTNFKDLGLNFKVNIEIPDVQEIGAHLSRFFSGAS